VQCWNADGSRTPNGLALAGMYRQDPYRGILSLESYVTVFQEAFCAIFKVTTSKEVTKTLGRVFEI